MLIVNAVMKKSDGGNNKNSNVVTNRHKNEGIYQPPNPNQNMEVITATSGDTSNWETYKSEKLGFTFKYPSTLEIKERGSNIDLLNGQVVLFSLTISQDNEEGIYIEVTQNEEIVFQPGGRDNLRSESDIFVVTQPLKAYYFDGYESGKPYIKIPIKRESFYYIVTFMNVTEMNDVMKGFLSTFRLF